MGKWTAGLRAAADAFEKAANAVNPLMLGAGIVSLAGMVLIVVADILSRFAFNTSVPGSLECVEFMMATTISSAIFHAAAKKAHIFVDMLYVHFNKRVRDALDVFTATATFLLYLLIVWGNSEHALDTYRSGLTSAVLHIPSFIFIAVVTLNSLMFALVVLVEVFRGTAEAASR